MSLPKQYHSKEAEPAWQAFWQRNGIYQYNPDDRRPVFSIDTPPPTVSGHLHLGHVYSYSHPDFMARFYRMNGYQIYYPMGYDDNGLPTERLVEKRLQIRAPQVGRQTFIEKCLQVSQEAERDYQALWQRLGLSIDWRYTYRTIEERCRRISQRSFLDLYRRGLAYHQEAPTLWCPECRTAIAQAELNDLERSTEFVFLNFHLENGASLPIATTRPELLPACVAIFVHPEDQRYQALIGQRAQVPLFQQWVTILADAGADPEKGSGAVMCCTFGDSIDVNWQRLHALPLIQAIDRAGHMTAQAGRFAGMPVVEARQQIKETLQAAGVLLHRQPTLQSVRVHERCDTPIEYLTVPQWFIRVLDFKEELLKAGEELTWHPEYMRARYRAWVENLSWDWCISRQRYFGVTFPVWYCQDCGAVLLADEDQLPVDPTETSPGRACQCGSTRFEPERDVMDTWATSSLSPQLAGLMNWGERPDQPPAPLAPYERVFPFSLRPQAHEIIRTWAFYTLVKSYHHFGCLPWKEVLISGWGLAGEGMGKISKSRGGGPMPPLQMIEAYSADAVRYWAASTGTGRDAVISEEKIQMGSRLVTKLWNVARFSERFLQDAPAEIDPATAGTVADRWILTRLQNLILRVTALFQAYDYAGAKTETETFFWRDLADNYLEMCKQRLYDETHPQRAAACYVLRQALYTVLQLFAPIVPYITEEIYQGLFASVASSSIHISPWPQPQSRLLDEQSENLGELLVEIASAVRRYKSEHNLPLGTQLNRLQLATVDPELLTALHQAVPDLGSITRANTLELVETLDPDLVLLTATASLQVAIAP